MSDRDPVGKIKRLEIGREHVKPRPVVPKGKFDRLEMRPVLEAARVPGERLGAVVVGVELINGQPIVGRREKPHRKHRAQQESCCDNFRVDCKARRPFSPPGDGTMDDRHFRSLADRTINVQPTDWCRSSE